jgi:hypothetical protein
MNTMVQFEERLTTLLLGNAAEDPNSISCGAITGYKEDDRIIVVSLKKLINEINEKRDRRFLISPVQYLEAENYASEKGHQLLGFYYLSFRKDFNEPEIKYALPGILYLSIVSGYKDPLIQAWSLRDNHKNISYHPVEIKTDVYDISSQLAIAV